MNVLFYRHQDEAICGHGHTILQENVQMSHRTS